MRYLLYGLVAVMCLAMVAAVQVKAHSWYPHECRSQYDCAPVLGDVGHLRSRQAPRHGGSHARWHSGCADNEVR
jgi:hypothetical protein